MHDAMLSETVLAPAIAMIATDDDGAVEMLGQDIVDLPVDEFRARGLSAAALG